MSAAVAQGLASAQQCCQNNLDHITASETCQAQGKVLASYPPTSCQLATPKPSVTCPSTIPGLGNGIVSDTCVPGTANAYQGAFCSASCAAVSCFLGLFAFQIMHISLLSCPLCLLTHFLFSANIGLHLISRYLECSRGCLSVC